LQKFFGHSAREEKALFLVAKEGETDYTRAKYRGKEREERRV